MYPEILQKKQYDRIYSQYEAHYGDPCSRRYRSRFIYGPLFDGINLDGKHFLEAMCGSGLTTEYLLSKGTQVTGLDISSEMIKSFKRKWPSCEAVCTSFLDNRFKESSFDGLVIVGGLHHLQPRVNEALDEVYRLLKRGGYFCFCEPHTGSLPDLIRRKWMKLDPLFAENEKTIDLARIQAENASRFDFLRTKYGGNVAYLLVCNSMVFRIPRKLKPFYTPVAMAMESIGNLVQGKRLSCFVICRWRKK